MKYQRQIVAAILVPLAAVLLPLATNRLSALESGAQELERRASEIHESLKECDPAEHETYFHLLKQLKDIGPEARIAIPTLKKLALSNREQKHGILDRHDAIETLIAMGHEATPVLRELLNDESITVQLRTVSALQVEPRLETEALVPDLMAIVHGNGDGDVGQDTEEPTERARLAGGLGNQKPPGEDVMQSELRSMALDVVLTVVQTQPGNRDKVREFLLERLRRRAHPSMTGIDTLGRKAIPVLRQIALESEDPGQRKEAARTLVEVDPEGIFSIPLLLKQFSDRGVEQSGFPFLYSPPVNLEAIDRLKTHPSRDKIDPEKLSAAVRGLKPEERDETLELLALAKATSEADWIRQEFEKSRNSDPRRSIRLASALVRLDPQNLTPIDFLLNILNDETMTGIWSGGGKVTAELPLRVLAARALGFVPPKNRSLVLPSLRKTMEHREIDGLRWRVPPKNLAQRKPSATLLAAQAAWSVARLDREDETCIRFLSETPNLPFAFSTASFASVIRDEIASSVANVLGPRIDGVSQQLAEQAVRFDDGTGDPEFAFDILLSARPPRVEPLVKEAFRQLDQSDALDRFSAITKVIHSSQHLGPMLPFLYEQCQSTNVECRQFAVFLLGEMEAPIVDSVPVLLTACDDQRVRVRARAAASLGKLGSPASAALPKLQAMLDDPYNSVRQAAQQAIPRIEN